jgi:hypothetical protein
MKKIKYVGIVGILIAFVASITITYNINKIENTNDKNATIQNEFIISSKENNIVNVICKRTDGIKTIKLPNGNIVNANGKTILSIDQLVEENKEYVYEITDGNDIVTEESFITPKTHIEITRNDINVQLETVQNDILANLITNKIATNFVNIGTGEQNYIDTQETDMEEVFQNWASFGDGIWSYNTSTKVVMNSKNSTCFTGYYNPYGAYNDIEFSFNAKTTDSDDDMIGAMARFNRTYFGSSRGYLYTSYLFLLDAHDSNKGVGNGAYNGLSKVQRKEFLGWGGTMDDLELLSVNSNLKWTRNKWENYKMIVKGDKIEAYKNNVLIASATDTSISSGTYGFVAMSQAYTYFKDIVIYTNKEYTLTEIINKITWDKDSTNIVVNLNDSKETVLSNNNCINAFNDNNINYLAVTAESNKQDVETFLQKIDGRGLWTDSTDYDDYIDNINQYLIDKLRLNILK